MGFFFLPRILIPLSIETLTVARDPLFGKQCFELSVQYINQQIAPSKIQ
jgi:hypothetical protein